MADGTFDNVVVASPTGGVLRFAGTGAITSGGYAVYQSTVGNFQFQGGSSGYAFQDNAGPTNLMYITNGGNVGIGTTVPAYHLEVKQATDGQWPGIHVLHPTEGTNHRATIGFGIKSDRSVGWVMGQGLAAAAIRDFYLYDIANGLRFYASTDGKIGINTSMPRGTLDVSPLGTGAADAIAISYAVAGYHHAIRARFVGGDAALTNMQLMLSDAQGGSVTRSVMTLTGAGRVGIGLGFDVTPPRGTLEVKPSEPNGGDAIVFSNDASGYTHAIQTNFVGYNDSLTNMQFRISNLGGPGTIPVMTLTAAGTVDVRPKGDNGGDAIVLSNTVSGYNHAIRANFVGGHDSLTNLQFLVSNLSGAGADNVMTLTAARNVGINTTTPQATLDVVGTTRFGGGTYTWPSGAGSLGQVLSTNGSGGLSWVNQASGPSTNYWSQPGSSLHPTDLAVKVGIGIQAPDTKLQVTNGSGELLFRLSADNNNDPRLTVRIRDATSNQPLFEYLLAADNGVQPNLALAPDGGNVAIGTSTISANSKFEVAGGPAVFGGGVAGVGISLREFDDPAKTPRPVLFFNSQNQVVLGTANNDASIQGHRVHLQAGGATRMSFDITGDIGIGQGPVSNVRVAITGPAPGSGGYALRLTGDQLIESGGSMRIGNTKIADANGCYYA